MIVAKVLYKYNEYNFLLLNIKIFYVIINLIFNKEKTRMKNSIKLAIALGMLFVINGCSGKSDYQLVQTDRDVKNVHTSSRSIEYKILKQDRLQIVLYKDPQQTSEVGGSISESLNSDQGVLVDTAGNVALPLIGRVNVAGLSQTQAAERIRQRYKKYLNDPSIYVEVMNKRLFVMGEVNKPGVINIDKEKMTLFEALANAGDLTDAAVRNEVMILSNSPKGMQIRTVDLTSFDTMSYSDLMLRPNDIVYVKPNKWKKFRVASDDMTSPFVTIAKVMAPFVTLKYLSD